MRLDMLAALTHFAISVVIPKHKKIILQSESSKILEIFPISSFFKSLAANIMNENFQMRFYGFLL